MKGGISLQYLKVDRLFSVPECQKIIEIGLSGHMDIGKVSTHLVVEQTAGEAFLKASDGFTADDKRRSCTTSYHSRSLETGWIFDRMDKLFLKAAEKFGFTVEETREDVKFIRYEPGDHFSKWHADCDLGYTAYRKVSMSVELGNPSSYSGGFLEIFPDGLESALRVPQGGAVAFPSFKHHRVTPVKDGVRYSLVNWISGPEFT